MTDAGSDPRATLRAAGYDVGEVLGAGMEGTVVILDDDRVVKLWDRRTRADVDRLRTRLADHPGPHLRWRLDLVAGPDA